MYSSEALVNLSQSPLLQEKEKQREISSLLGGIMEDQYAMLCGLGRKITDYGADKHASAGGDTDVKIKMCFVYGIISISLCLCCR